MLIIWAQNKKLGMMRVLRELFPILLGYKPAIDAYRVATGARQEVGKATDPMVEMAFMKAIEMFAEAIPGVIIQLMAIVTNDEEIKAAAWISLAVSALTTGFASATISYDYDTDPKRRKQVPDFYGYIPAKASKRSLVFVLMVLLTTGMLLIRCTTIVVLGLIGGSWVALYVGCDLGLYLVVKILRGDFWYWAPVGGNAEIFTSILARVLVKLVTDFTSIVQFRHPNEVGGFYWLFGIVLTMGTLPIAIILAERTTQKVEVIGIARAVAMNFIPFTVLDITLFMWNIEKKYLGTFISLQRGKDGAIQRFREPGDDQKKAKATFENSKHYWKSIAYEVRVWVETNWERWEEEKPEWFNDAMKARVPVEYIPINGDARRRESVRRASVDAEAEGGLGGILRASIRRASLGGTIERHVKVVPIEGDN
jgi:hypothetical protein